MANKLLLGDKVLGKDVPDGSLVVNALGQPFITVYSHVNDKHTKCFFLPKRKTGARTLQSVSMSDEYVFTYICDASKLFLSLETTIKKEVLNGK